MHPPTDTIERVAAPASREGEMPSGRPDVSGRLRTLAGMRPTTRGAAPATGSGAAGLGAVFTRRWAANLVLDLAGYTEGHDLAGGTAIEPSCGGGAFLVPMIDRLASSCRRHGTPLRDAAAALRAFDLDPGSAAAAGAAVRERLAEHGVSERDASRLSTAWVRHGDFLLEDLPAADWVVGNPPYVRLEDVPADRSAQYRRRWDAMQGRADVYVGFFQAGLQALRPGGVLAFICADRWMRNQYGRPLRRIVEQHHAVEAVVTLHGSDAFDDKVAAYPAIVAIRSGTQGPALVADGTARFGPAGAASLSALHAAGPSIGTPLRGEGYTAAWTPRWFAGAPSWPAGTAARLALVADLERRFPALGDERGGATVGIGLATGADAVYVTRDADAAEASQLLPLAMAADLRDGKVVWSGAHLISPWRADGGLADLDGLPRLKAHYEQHAERLRARHVGRRQPDRWYRTIDRPVAGLAERSKLLLPDLRHRVAPVLETGGLYPHHNLYWITSDDWDLRVLGGLLLSDFATLFVETYSPRMAGGALRVTAQYLKRICLPEPAAVARDLAARLAAAFDARDVEAATRAAASAYRVDPAVPPCA
jgi:hypothetical protein